MIATSISSKSQSEHTGTSIQPNVLLPTTAQMARLDADNRAALRRLFGEPMEYIDHELFHKSNAEKLIFGKNARLDSEEAFLDDDNLIDPTLAHFEEGRTLTTRHEIELFQKFNYSRMRILSILGQYHGKRMPDSALRELLAWSRRADIQCSLIAQANMPLVLAMAKRTRLNGLDPNELISEGNFALLRAIDKFDCSRGFKFSTYACRAILKSFSRVAMWTSRYRGRFPTEFDPSLEKSNFIERKRDGLKAQCVDEIRDIIDHNRAELNEIERTVIRERFALDAGPERIKGKTLEQVGELIGVTKERVRQIQNKALRKLRDMLEDGFLAASG
ncbi:MAG: sigma-70 family RNA polymerase sigma factor [Phycisphaerales bacterium]|nr:sigma-70 family RNA polymerase sigma factor [Phycisphaerales bacterium]